MENTTLILRNARDEKKIDQSIAVFNQLEPVDRQIAIYNLSRSLASHPHLNHKLARKLKDPLRLLKELSQIQIQQLLRTVDRGLFNLITSKIPSEDLIALQIKPLSDEDTGMANGKEYDEAVDDFFNAVDRLMKSGDIEYQERDDHLIYVEQCNQHPQKINAKVRVVLPSLIVGERRSVGIDLFRERKIERFRVCIRYSDIDEKEPPVFETTGVFDYNGYSRFYTHTFRQKGIYLISVYDEKDRLIGQNRLLVLPEAEESLMLEMDHQSVGVDAESGILTVGGMIQYRDKVINSTMLAKLYCGCGSLVGIEKVKVEKGQFRFSQQTGTHEGPFLLKIESMVKKLSATVLLEKDPSVQFDHWTECQLDKNKLFSNPGDYRIRLKAQEKAAVFHGLLRVVSEQQGIDEMIRQLTSLSFHRVYGDSQFAAFNQMLSNNVITLYARPVPKVDVESYVEQAEFLEQKVVPGEQMGNRFLHVAFIQKSGKHLSIFKDHVKLKTPPIMAWFPPEVLPDDEVEAGFLIHTDEKIQLTLQKDDEPEEKRAVIGQVDILFPVTSSTRITAKAEFPNGKKWQFSWPQKRETDDTIYYRKVNKGTILTEKELILYPNLDYVTANIAKSALSYPCRCAEQTSSIIVFLHILKEYYQKDIQVTGLTEHQVDTELEKEIRRICSYQDKNGGMWLWGKGQEGGEFSPCSGLDLMVYQNLKPLAKKTNSSLEQLTDQLGEYIRTEKKGVIRSSLERQLIRPVRNQSVEQINQMIRKKLIIDHNIGCRDFDSFKHNQYYGASVLQFLLKHDQQEMEYCSKFRKTKKVEKGWFPKILEKLNIRPRKRWTDVEEAFSKTDDGPGLLIEKMLGKISYGGYWGSTSTTANSLKSLVVAAEKRPMVGEFRVEGNRTPVVLDQVLKIKNKKVKILSDEAIVGIPKRNDPIQKALSYPIKSQEFSLSIDDSKDSYQIGESCKLNWLAKGTDIQHPVFTLYHSDIVEVEEYSAHVTNQNGALTFSPAALKGLRLRLTRRGKAGFLGYVSDMYQTDIRYQLRLEVNVA